MAVEKFTDALIFYSGWNLSGQSNTVALNRSAAMLDVTVFGNNTRVNTPGLDEITASVSGFWYPAGAAGGVDPMLYNAQGGAGAPLTIAPKNASLGVAYMFPAVEASFNFLGTFGEATPFDAEFQFAQYASAGVRQQCRGVIGLQPSAITGASGAGAYLTLGSPVSSTQYLVLAVHVIATDSSSLTFVLESDDNTGFATATSRITTGVLSGGSGGQSFYGHLLGPVATDTYYRVSYTRSGGSTFTALATFGVYEPRGLAA